MALALYRKYRPQKFVEVNGQNHIKLTLQNELKNQMIGHAYLFCGPRGTGKTTMARLMAKAVNCLNLAKNGEPCNECESCKNFVAGKLMDIIEIDAASHTGVDNVRDNIINNARFTPSISRYKVFIIDEVHMLSIQAFNALLKLLEEPPAHVIFILATTEIHKVPLTIISRCQRFDFRRVAFKDLVERLQYVVNRENIKVDKQVLELVARQVNGCVRDAESLLDQILSLGEKEIGIDEASLIIPKSNFDSLNNLLKFLVQKDARQAIELVNQLVVDGVDIQQFVNEFIDFCRRGLLYKIKNSLQDLAEDVGEDRISAVVELLDGVEVSLLVKIIRYFLRAKEELKLSPILQLPIEIAVIEITQPVGMSLSQQTKSVSKPQDFVEAASAPTSVSLEKNNKSDSIDLSNIQSRWPEFLQFLKNKNYSLSISLSVCFPVKVEDGALVIGFLFGLQKDRVDNPSGQKLVCEKIKEFFGVDVAVRCIIDSTIQMASTNGKNSTSEQSMDGVLEAFGGEIIA
ncbi:MAG: DNA polymerase III subunit gamma/tau [Candidatus Falkowbacteria bacterium]